MMRSGGGNHHLRATAARLVVALTVTMIGATGLAATPAAAAAPVTRRDVASTFKNQQVQISPLGNDWDPDGDGFSIVSVATPAHGTIQGPYSGSYFYYTPTTGYAGVDTITYTVQDGTGASATGQVKVGVDTSACCSPSNPPTADPDYFMTAQGVSKPISAAALLANDSDPTNQVLSITNVSDADSGGTLSGNPVSGFTYNPRASFTGIDSFDYLLFDSAGHVVEGNVEITVTPTGSTNQAPVTRRDVARTGNGDYVQINPLGNDSDPDNDSFSIVSVETPANGYIQGPYSGSYFYYYPDPGFAGQDTITYVVRDSAGLIGFGSVDIWVDTTPCCDTTGFPNADPDYRVTPQDTALPLTAGGLLVNDSDPTGQVLTMVAVADTANGGLISGSLATGFSYQPPPGFTGIDSVHYLISDTDGHIVEGTVEVTVVPAGSTNQAPVTRRDIARTGNGNYVQINPLGNDSDPDNDSFSIVSVETPANGYIQGPYSGYYFYYYPDPGFAGQESLTYVVRDSAGLLASGTVQVWVDTAPCCDTTGFPTADVDYLVTPQDTAVGLSAADLLRNDADPAGQVLTVVAVADTANGGLIAGSVATGFSYQPPPGFTGIDSVQYLISDTDGHIVDGTVDVTVTPTGSTNQAPVTRRDIARTGNGNYVQINPLGNDSDPDNDSFSIVSVETPAHGSIQGPYSGYYFYYYPDPGYAGLEPVIYVVRDSAGLIAYGTVNVWVDSVPCCDTTGFPTVGNDYLVTPQDTPLPLTAGTVLLNDTDPSGQILTVVAVADTAAGGLISGTVASGFTYHPPPGFSGSDTVTYFVSDPDGHIVQGTIEVTVVPTGSTNQPPVAVADVAASPTGSYVQINPLGNDSDPDNDSFSMVSVETPAHGYIQGPYSGYYFYYYPDASFTGIETIRYTIRDSAGLVASTTVAVTVRGGTNHPPVAQSMILTAELGQSIPVTLSGSDPDGTAVTYSVVSPPAAGTLTGTAPNLTYDAPNVGGWQAFTYTTSDGSLSSAITVVYILVNPNQAPTPQADAVATLEDVGLNISVLSNDSDPNGDQLTITAVTDPADNGYASCTASACHYQPFPQFHGTDSFTYRVSDGMGATATAVVTVTVLSNDDAPIAQAIQGPINGGAIVLTATDSDSASLTFNVGPAGHGTVTPPTTPVCVPFSGVTTCTTTVTYNRTVGYVGPDVFSFTASDGTSTSAPAQVTIPDNGDPNAVPVASLLIADAEGTLPFSASVTPSATDGDGDPLTFSIDWGDGTAPSTGSLPSGAVGHVYSVTGTFQVQVTASDGTDEGTASGEIRTALSEPLTADAGDDRTVSVGETVELDGSNSRPVIGIDSSQWTFSDGPVLNGTTVSRSFATPGTFTATLAVTAGASTVTDSATITVIGADPGLDVTVTDGSSPLAGADVLVVDADGVRTSAVTDGSGVGSLNGLADGTVTVYAFAEGYVPAIGTATVSGGTGSLTIALSSGDVGSSVVESRLLTLPEILAAGIDPGDPDNQHVYEFEIWLFFGDLKYTGYVNGAGEILGDDWTGGSGGGGGGGGSAGTSIEYGEYVIYPTSSASEPDAPPFINYLVIPGKAKFLKEFFEVKMVVNNLAPPGFSFTNGHATLELPAGLSLAPTATEQNLEQVMVDIPGGGGSASATWIVRGDVEGEYLPAAAYSGVLAPIGKPVYLRSGVNPATPLKVWAGSALEMIVRPDDFLVQYAPYRVDVGLHNVSDIPVYNPVVELLETGRVGYIYQPLETLEQGTDVVMPGDTFWAHYVLMPWIPGGNLLIEESFVKKTGGDVDLDDVITSMPAPASHPAASASHTAGVVTANFASVAGAAGYDVFVTKDLPTVNGLQPDLAFPAAPIASTDNGAATSLVLPTAGLSGFNWVGISVRFADGHREMLHNLVEIPNAAPTGGTDSGYVAATATALNVAAPGVLANDADADGDLPLTAVSASVPAHGTVSLATDGGFSYTSAPGYTGADSFTYKVRDALGAESAPVTVSITVAAGGVVSATPGGVSVTEGDSGTKTISVPLTLTQASSQTVTVQWYTLDGVPAADHATAGSDYVAATGTITFLPGETVKHAVVTVNGDTTVEQDEVFAIVFHTPTNATVGGFFGLGFGQIFNDDSALTILPSGTSVTEGLSGTVTANVPVALSKPSAQTVTVDWVTFETGAADIANAGSDYVAASGTVTFLPGETAKTVPVTVNGDNVVEVDEFLLVSFRNPTNAVVGGFLGLGASMIVNDDQTQLVPGGTQVVEGNAGTTTMTLPIYLSQPSSQTVTANWTTLDTVGADRASTPSDYVAASGTVTFAPGEMVKTVNVTINGDTVAEAQEYVIVSLSAPVNATVGGFLGLGLGGIIDDEGPLTLIPGGATISEGQSGTTVLQIPVYLSGVSALTVTAGWNTLDLVGADKATSVNDFVAASGTVTFLPGETVQYVSITINGDAIPELSETFAVTFHTPTNATIGGFLGLGVGYLVNDDG